jgi:hypothetical protein
MAGDDMDQLLKALRETARAEDRADEAALAQAEAGQSAHLDQAARERIAASLLEAPTGVVSLEGRRRARRRWTTWLAVPLAAAAALLLVARPRPTALPGYELVATGGLREVRGLGDQPDRIQRLAPGSVLDVKLRPATAVQGSVLAMAFAVQGGRADPVSPIIEVAPSGAVSVRAEAASVFGERRGRWELRIFLARPSLAAELRALAVGPRTSGPGWQRLSVPVELLP